MVMTYTPAESTLGSSPIGHSDATMVASRQEDGTVPETAETPSPPNTGDVEDPSSSLPGEAAEAEVFYLKDQASTDSIPGSEEPTGELVLPPTNSPVALDYPMETVPDVLDSVSDPVEEKEQEQLSEEYVQDCLKLLEEFKKTLQEVSFRSGPPFPVADGLAFDRLMKFFVRMAQEGFDDAYKQCINFYQENLCPAFTKLYTDDSLSSWSSDVQAQIFRRSQQAVQLVALKMKQDLSGMLELLAVLLNPTSRFMNLNSSRHSETFPTVILPLGRSNFSSLFPASSSNEVNKTADLKTEEDVIPQDVFARCYENRNPRGYLVDYLNIFGKSGGFNFLTTRIVESPEGNPLTISLLVALLKPFGNCAEYLTKRTVEESFLKVFRVVPSFLESMTDEDFKKESGKQDGKTDPVSTILRSLKMLAKVLPEHSNDVNQIIEVARLSAIKKLLKVSTYNGKMHALNEINRIIQSLTYTHRPFLEEDTALGPEKVAKWLLDNRLLSVILADSMHQPQYVEKLEKIIRFMIREKCLTIQDLDDLWAAQSGKHEAIVKNVHDLLTKLAWDFSPPHLDHLFGHFQGSWVSASRRQREKLLELIRRLAEDDKEGVMAVKVLDLLWSLCHNDELPAEIMDQALAAHLKIIDYTCSHDRDGLKMVWLRKCVEEIKTNTWVIPALRHIKNICDQYGPENSNTMVGMSGMGGSIRTPATNRSDVVKRLIEEEHIIPTVSSSLEQYLDQVRFVQLSENLQQFDPMTQDLLHSKFSHYVHVDERLAFLRYVLQHGKVFLEDPYKLWTCLAEHPVVETDRDLCFKWFSKLMTADDDPDLKPEMIKEFYEGKILQLEPLCLTESGLECFSRFLIYVNTREGKLEWKRKQHYLQQFDLVGIEYLWKVILTCGEDISQLGIDLLRDLYASPSSKIQANIVGLHQEVIQECVDRLTPIHDNLNALHNDKLYHNKIVQDTNKAVRILKVIVEYIQQYDKEYGAERLRPPLSKATYGIGFIVLVKGSQNHRPEEIDISTHTNDTVGGLRRMIYQRYRVSPGAVKLDLLFNNELLLPQQDRRLITELGGFDFSRERPIITVKVAGSPSFQTGVLPDMTTHSSPESSNDISPVDTPQGAFIEETSLDNERHLPGVWISQKPAVGLQQAEGLVQKPDMQFFVRLADLGSRLANANLLNTARELLGLLPADESVLADIKMAATDDSVLLDTLFHSPSPSKVLYNLQVLQSLLLPARLSQFDEAATFGAELMTKRPLMDYILNMLTRNNFIDNTDVTTKQQCYQCVLRLVKLVLHILYAVGVEAQNAVCQRNNSVHNTPSASGLATLRRGFTEETLALVIAMRQTPGQSPSDIGIRHIAGKISLIWRTRNVNLPQLDTLKALRQLAWTAASGSLNLLECPEADARSALQKRNQPLSQADALIAEEALDCLMLCFPLTSKSVDSVITQNQSWLQFFEDMLIICKEPAIRRVATRHFSLIATQCTTELQPLDYVLVSHFSHLIQKESKQRPETCDEVFRFVSTLLKNFSYVNRPLKEADTMLKVELDWLAHCRKICAEGGRMDVHDTLLEGHLLLIKEIVRTLHPSKKRNLRTKENRPLLIQELIEDFLFPTARVLLKMANQRHNSISSLSLTDAVLASSLASSSSSSDLFDAAYSDPLALLEMPNWARPICQSPASINAAFEVIIALCTGSAENLNVLNETLTLLFYSECESPITDWEYSPPVGPRRTDGFVGLKNAGATCYMNSVLQQLYMIPSVRNGVLTIEGISNNYVDDEVEEKGEGDAPNSNFVGPLLPFSVADDSVISAGGDFKQDSSEIIPFKAPAPAQDYNTGLIKQLQVLFSHLACSKLQFFIPRGFWKHFRLGSEPVNLREQHDALEFYNSVVDCVDEGLKAAKKSPLMGQVLGGTFADQKICRDCPHRYSREEPFTSLSLDIRNFHTLQDALEHYVKGDLLEGANAYFCEKCQRKVDTVKRLCIKRLPPILTIQLKRFDYDWEREQPIKFNDYFEFPRQIDMQPYTAAGLAKSEGYTIQDEEDIIREVEESSSSGAGTKWKRPANSSLPATLYRLVGIVVHSGQATGGHYYSYILDRDGEPKWYRFDDGEVTECKMDDDDEMKAQCFGEDVPGQKRWWNAYLLFYERVDVLAKGPAFHERERSTGRIRMQSESIGAQIVHMIPTSLRNVILKQNLKFMHSRSQFIPEYFAFLKRLLMCTPSFLSVAQNQLDHVARLLDHQHQHPQQIALQNQRHLDYQQRLVATCLRPEDIDAIGLAVVQLLGKFIFDVCFRTRRQLRGPAHEWSEPLAQILKVSPSARRHFTENVIFKNSRRIFEYLLECPTQDIRTAFSRVLAHLAYYSCHDGACLPATLQAASSAGYHFETVPQSVEELILMACISLVSRKEISDHSRQIATFLNVFVTFATGDDTQRETLIRLGVPELLIRIAIDEIPYPLFKYNAHADISKLYVLVSTMVLYIDFSDLCRSVGPDTLLSPNPFGADYHRLAKASPDLCQLFLYNNLFIKRLIDDAIQLEEVKTAIKYLCWESPEYTQRTVCAILTSLAAQYNSDVRQLMEFAFGLIQMDDSWLDRRIQLFLLGLPSESVEGFLSIMQRNRMSNPRKAYLCFKYLLLMSADNVTFCLLQSKDMQEFRNAYTETCDWLQQELQGSSTGRGNQYYNSSGFYGSAGGFNWNNQIAVSNESSNGSHLERTNSARALLEKALDYLTTEENDMSLPAMAASSGGEEEEEEEDDAVSFGIGAASNMSDQDDLHFDLDASRMEEENRWKSAGESLDFASADAGSSLTGMLGSAPETATSPRSPYKAGINRSFVGARRNGALHEDVKEKLIMGGLIPAGLTADKSAVEDADIVDLVRNFQLEDSPHSNSGSIIQESFRPGTPVQDAELEYHGPVSRRQFGADPAPP